MRIKTKREQQKKRNRRRIFHFILLFSFASDFFFLFTVWINVYNSFIQLAVLKSTTVDAVTVVLYYVPTLLLVSCAACAAFCFCFCCCCGNEKKVKETEYFAVAIQKVPTFWFLFQTDTELSQNIRHLQSQIRNTIHKRESRFTWMLFRASWSSSLFRTLKKHLICFFLIKDS